MKNKIDKIDKIDKMTWLKGFGILALAWTQNVVLADGPLMPKAIPKVYRAECGACHTAYAPSLLPATSWRNIMGNLNKHYGTDASLDTAQVKEIATWLDTNAGTYKRVNSTPPPQDRITRSAWFERKHRHIAPAVWQHASVKSAANCAACHTQADTGNFDEHQIQYPDGLPNHLRRGFHD